MSLSNTATPKYYGMFRDAVIRGEIAVNEKVSMEMNLINRLKAKSSLGLVGAVETSYIN